MRVHIKQKRIFREDLRSNSSVSYLFGDNLERKGMSGQAHQMRGEPNAIGIPTKKFPSMHPNAFFNDEEFEANKKAIDEALSLIPETSVVVSPLDGIGTGLARLDKLAPKTFEYLKMRLENL